MASIPKPSLRGRRLLELLEEQQEPFLLDVYLLENGYSNKTLKPEVSIMCWAGYACRRLKRLTSHGFKRRRGGIVRCILTELVYGKVLRKAMNWDSKVPLNGEFGVFDPLSDIGTKTNVAEFDRLSCSGGNNVGEFYGELQCKCIEDDKQLSLVSVLELQSVECSPVLKQTKEENPSTSGINSTPGTPRCLKTKELNQTKQLLLDCVREVEERIWEAHKCLSPERIGKIIHEHILSLEKQKEDLTNTVHLVDSDISNTWKERNPFKPQIREIGIAIEGVIFEEIREQAVLDMLDLNCTLE